MRKSHARASAAALLAVLTLAGGTPANAESTAIARYRTADSYMYEVATATAPSTQIFMMSRRTGYQYWDLDPALGSSTTIVNAATGQCMTATQQPPNYRLFAERCTYPYGYRPQIFRLVT